MKKPPAKKSPKAPIKNLELLAMNLALEKTNRFLEAFQKRLSKKEIEDKEKLNLIIRAEIQKNKKLSELITTGNKKARLDHEDKKELRKANAILQKSEDSLSETIKKGKESYRKLEKNMAAGTSAAKDSKARLRKKDLEIEQLNKEILTIAKISSHDLQEPLRNIQVFTSLLLEKEHANLSAQGKDYFSRMQKSATRVRRLIQDLSDYSHLNKSFYKLEKTDLNQLLKEVEKELKTAITKTHATITSDDLPKIKVVPFHIRKIFKELICNSLTFTRPNVRPRIQVNCIKEKGMAFKDLSLNPKKIYYRITFTDNGSGFDPAYKERIFEVFQKLDGKDNPGTGIGLATCRKIIENYEGKITADGMPGKGAVFTVYIVAS